MARENQGLQIALIIFFMLTIMLIVTTFIFVSKYREAEEGAKVLQKDVRTAEDAAETIQSDYNDLKTKIGFKAKDELAAISQGIDEDMEKYAGGDHEDRQNYRQVVKELHNEIVKLSAEKKALEDQIAALKVKHKQDLASEKAQVAAFNAEKTKYESDVKTLGATFESQRTRIDDEKKEIQSNWDQSREQATAKLTAVQAKLREAGTRLQKLLQLNQQKSKKLEQVVKETFDVPDGEIRWVNQRNGTVWINLGRADALPRQITFSVYSADTTNLTTAGKKASIEVTQIRGEHLAEARVIEDNISDPIIPGDKIHTPAWSPGEQRRFALTGLMDIDGDDKSDVKTIRNLITMNGGIVDAWVDENGDRHGLISINTRYLVRGREPDAGRDPKAYQSYSHMNGKADENGVEKISLEVFLQRVGWKNQTPVIRFGRGANPKDFRAKPAGGVPRVSSGNVSGLYNNDFKQRRPPTRKAPGRGGAY